MFDLFIEKYDKITELNYNYRIIIFELIRKMEKECSIEPQKNFSKNFVKYKKEQHITYEELAELVAKELNKDISNDEDFTFVDVNSIKSYSRASRETKSSKYSKAIATIFGVSEDMLYYGEDKLTVYYYNANDIKILFNSLSEQNKKAIIYLLDALYLEKTSPEIFEDSWNDNDF